MGRDVPFDNDCICDICGKLGAYDFMGDCLCPDCAREFIPYEPTKIIAELESGDKALIDPPHIRELEEGI